MATMDGTELTAIRTPATTLLAVKHILAAAPGGAADGPPDASSCSARESRRSTTSVRRTPCSRRRAFAVVGPAPRARRSR